MTGTSPMLAKDGRSVTGESCASIRRRCRLANQVFSPSAEDRDWALRVLAAYEEAARNGEAAIAIDGQMIDEPMARRARAIIDVAQDS